MTSITEVLVVGLIFFIATHAQITVIQTAESTGDMLTMKPSIQWQVDNFTLSVNLQVNTSVKFQSIVGFGAAFTEASSYNYQTLNATLKQQILEAFWGSTGIHFTLMRLHMNSCDYCFTSYSEDNEAGDYMLSNFTIAHDQIWVVPFIRAAISKSQVPIKLFFSPWSPPAWMKINGMMNGSAVPLGLIQNPKIFAAWALFFSKYITAYQKIGLDFWALTIQNEPEYAAPYEACVWTPESQRDFIKGYLGPQIATDHPDVKIMIYDHNKDHVAIWAQTILSDPDAAKYVAGTAFHWYTGPYFENLAAAHAVDPSKFLLATENAAGIYWTDGESVGYDVMGDLNNWSVGWVAWNIMLNPEGGPNHVNAKTFHSLVLADAVNQTLTFHPSYYYLGQFSKYLLPGSVRVNATCDGYLLCTAFVRPDNYVAVVVMNIIDFPITFKLQQGTKAAQVIIPQHAIATLLYQNF